MKYCPMCGNRVKELREGIPLSDIKIRIYDLISKRPGITRRELAEIVYGDCRPGRIETVSAHVKQIRDSFLDHPKIKIVGKSGNGYRIIKQRVALSPSLTTTH
jgi:DNA-binding response OmpR family regulator